MNSGVRNFTCRSKTIRKTLRATGMFAMASLTSLSPRSGFAMQASKLFRTHHHVFSCATQPGI
jgi:hypothetical protein